MSTVAFSLGKAKRSKFPFNLINLVDGSINKTAVTNPGPGSYAQSEKILRYKSSPSFGVGTAKRSEMANPQLKKVPGPGLYETKTNIGEGPKFHIASKHKTGGIFVNNQVPGPN